MIKRSKKLSRLIAKLPGVATSHAVVVVAMATAVIAAIHVGKLPLALPLIRADLGLDIISAGWLASIFSVTGMASAIIFGAFASLYSPWRVGFLGLSLLAASGLVGAFSYFSWQLFLSRFFEGLGFLAAVVAAPSLIASAMDGRRRDMVLGIYSAYMPVGVTLMILTSPAVLHVGGWRLLWIIVATLAITGAILMLVVSQAHPTPSQPRIVSGRSIQQALAQSGPWLNAVSFALYASQLYAFIVWMPTFIITERGIDAASASALTAMIVVINGSCSFGGAWLLRRGVAPWIMILAAGAVMALSAFVAFSISVPDIVRYGASLTLCGAGGIVAAASFASPPMFASTPSQTAVLNGLIVQASCLAQFAGPTTIAIGVSYFGGWESALWLIVGANLLMMALALCLRTKLQRLIP